MAAIKGVTTGVFLEQIRQYESEVIENDILNKKLQEMTAKYEIITQKVIDTDYPDYLDFHTRRLVEMAGNIIMGYLLVLNSQRDEKFTRSAKIFIDLARSENQEKYDYMDNFEVESIELYKIKDSEILQEIV